MTRDQVQSKMTAVIHRLRDLILFVSVRIGKTKIAMDAIDRFQTVLWAYPNQAMMEGYKEDIIKFNPKSDIVFVNQSSIKKYADTSWDILVIDEPQELSAAQIRHLKTIKYKKRVGLSGTLSDKTLRRLKSELNWQVGAEYHLEDAIRDELVKDYKILIWMTELDNVDKTPYDIKGKTTYTTEKKAYGFYQMMMEHFQEQADEAREEQRLHDIMLNNLGFKKYQGLNTNLIYNSQALLNVSQMLVDKYKDQKAIIYTLRTEVADSLSDKTFHSKNKDDDALEWFKDSITGHLGAVNCITTGITIRNLDVVIFHSYVSNTEKFHQKLARSLMYEFKGDFSKVLVACIKDTENERWVEDATASLSPDKIYYRDVDGLVYTKSQWLKKKYPDKVLYLTKAGKVVWFHNVNLDGKHTYAFPSNPNIGWAFHINNLKRIV